MDHINISLATKTRGEQARDYFFKWFNQLFGSPPKYSYLINRKKEESERDIRSRVIKRKRSLFNRTIERPKAWDFYVGPMKTCQKNGANFYNLLFDRLSKERK